MRHLVVGAEKLTEEVQQLCFEKFGLRVLEGYGATECSPVIAVNTPLAHRTGSVGEILPGMEYRVLPVPGVDQGGVLHVRGDNLMLGYLNDNGTVQQTASEAGEGWYNTGDVVAVENEFIKIQARLKRFAKVAGEMVSLETVERIAAAARPEYLHAATSYKDSMRGEIVLLFTEDKALSREQLQEAARRLGAPELALPRRIIHLDKIPLLANGKKDYLSLARRTQEMHAGVHA
jgi:acyl-[acyl-carrier-protein]-phospholipid O-acyltransferase/long-chain-fatty-acid--[acyl-carrier-protein] ligase